MEWLIMSAGAGLVVVIIIVITFVLLGKHDPVESLEEEWRFVLDSGDTTLISLYQNAETAVEKTAIADFARKNHDDGPTVMAAVHSDESFWNGTSGVQSSAPVAEPIMETALIEEPAIDPAPVEEPIEEPIPVEEPTIEITLLEERIIESLPIEEPITTLKETFEEKLHYRVDPEDEPAVKMILVEEPVAEITPVEEPIDETTSVEEELPDEAVAQEEPNEESSTEAAAFYTYEPPTPIDLQLPFMQDLLDNPDADPGIQIEVDIAAAFGAEYNHPIKQEAIVVPSPSAALATETPVTDKDISKLEGSAKTRWEKLMDDLSNVDQYHNSASDDIMEDILKKVEDLEKRLLHEISPTEYLADQNRNQ